jgi:hypothetical protein
MDKRIPTLNEHINEGKEQTIKSKVLDYIETLGGIATWKQLHDFILKTKGLPIDKSTRGQFASYFSGSSSVMASRYNKPGTKTAYSHGLLERPTKQDPRYIEKDDNGMWVLKIDNKK